MKTRNFFKAFATGLVCAACGIKTGYSANHQFQDMKNAQGCNYQQLHFNSI